MMNYKSMGKLQGRRNRGGALPSPHKNGTNSIRDENILDKNLNDVLGLGLKIITVRGNFFNLAVGPVMRDSYATVLSCLKIFKKKFLPLTLKNVAAPLVSHKHYKTWPPPK